MKNGVLTQLDEQAAQLGCLATEGAASDNADTQSVARPARPKASDVIIGLAIDANIDLFHTPGADGEAFATIEYGDHRQTYAVNSRQFKRYLGGLYYRSEGSAANSQSVQDAAEALAGRAIYDGDEHAVHVRIAEVNGTVYLDLGDSSGTIVRARPGCWDLIHNPPVRFVRPRGMEAMPIPAKGGSIDEWRETINVPDESWPLLVTCVMSYFRPGVPQIMLGFNGEQGAAKSEVCRQTKALVDPNKAGLRAQPRDVRDLVIAAKNSWILAYDNISSIPPYLSDAFCRVLTGGGVGFRELYTDAEEFLIDVQNPIMINGITEVASRSDLLDRAVMITLPAIPEEKRRSEAEVHVEFERRRPRIMGAFLTALAEGLAKLPSIRVDCLPRMADYALLGVAAEQALGLRDGQFLLAYRNNRRNSHDLVLEATPVVPALLSLMAGIPNWSGVSRSLLEELNLDAVSTEEQRRQKAWPKDARVLTAALKRVAPDLRANGLNVSFGDRTREGVAISLSWVPTADTSGDQGGVQ